MSKGGGVLNAQRCVQIAHEALVAYETATMPTPPEDLPINLDIERPL